MKYTELLKDAAVIVRGKLLWKRFIDGTPLSNDLPFWMADFAAAAIAHEREACAKICESNIWSKDVAWWREATKSEVSVESSVQCAVAIRARGEA